MYNKDVLESKDFKMLIIRIGNLESSVRLGDYHISNYKRKRDIKYISDATKSVLWNIEQVRLYNEEVAEYNKELGKKSLRLRKMFVEDLIDVLCEMNIDSGSIFNFVDYTLNQMGKRRRLQNIEEKLLFLEKIKENLKPFYYIHFA